MAAQITGVLEPTLQDKIVTSKILVVGAGGIGCEVLKNLVMTGFPDIEIVSKFPKKKKNHFSFNCKHMSLTLSNFIIRFNSVFLSNWN